MNMNMNRLPVPTWNHLGVNFAPDKAALPQVPANGWGTAAATAAVPAGIRTNGPETEIFETFTESGMGVAADAFLAANANVKEHLAVGEGAAIETPAVFEVKLDEAHPCALSCLTIDAAKGSSLTVVQVLRGDAEDGVAASLVRINAAEGAHVKLVQVQLLGNNASRWGAVAIRQAAGSRVEQVRIELGGKVSVCGTRTLQDHNKSEYDLDAVYFGRDNDVLDYNDVSVQIDRAGFAPAFLLPFSMRKMRHQKAPAVVFSFTV